MTIGEKVKQYVAFKRHLGYKYATQEKVLLAYADHAMTHGDQFLTVQRIVKWAGQAVSPKTAQCRFSTLHRFALWLHAEDECHEIPPRDSLGRIKCSRPTPHLITPSQIERIMEAALSLGPAGSIRRHTYHYLIGLLAATGMRRSEALALRLADITSDGLVIRETKFRKSRLVPIQDSVQDALNRYLQIRKMQGGLDDHVFVLSNGRPPNPSTVTDMFIALARRTGIRAGPGEPGPRLHDLRHTFAVRSLEAVIATDSESVNRHMLALSTYLGHSRVSNTYWYLEATPVLLRKIADATERTHLGRIVQ